MSTTYKTIPQATIDDWASLLASLKGYIDDDCRCTDDSDDTEPGMCVTIGYTPASDDQCEGWDYQTGDNNYMGGAYGHPFWAVIYLHRDSDAKELAKEAVDELEERFFV